jgi:hypothetical protein
LGEGTAVPSGVKSYAPRVPRVALALCIALACAGCGATLVLHREIPRPADVPARAFPVVYVAGADDDASRAIADAIATHLEGGATRVVRTSPTDLLARASLEPTATLALLVTVTRGEELRTEMSRAPTSRCAAGSTGCYGYPERIPVEIRVQTADLVVRAFDPRSASELGHAVLREEESEPSALAAQLAVVDRLRERAPLLFDVRTETVDLELESTPDASAQAAIDAARSGRIHEARAALERRVADPALDAAARATISFDLAQLIRIDVDASAPDPLAEESARLAAAETQLLAALALSPSPRYERALEQLRAERRAREDVRAQEAAADTNFGLSQPP